MFPWDLKKCENAKYRGDAIGFFIGGRYVSYGRRIPEQWVLHDIDKKLKASAHLCGQGMDFEHVFEAPYVVKK